jgi:hypothetical protein
VTHGLRSSEARLGIWWRVCDCGVGVLGVGYEPLTARGGHGERYGVSWPGTAVRMGVGCLGQVTVGEIDLLADGPGRPR